MSKRKADNDNSSEPSAKKQDTVQYSDAFVKLPNTVQVVVLAQLSQTQSVGLTILDLIQLGKELYDKLNKPAFWKLALQLDFEDFPEGLVEEIRQSLIAANAVEDGGASYRHTWLAIRAALRKWISLDEVSWYYGAEIDQKGEATVSVTREDTGIHIVGIWKWKNDHIFRDTPIDWFIRWEKIPRLTVVQAMQLTDDPLEEVRLDISAWNPSAETEPKAYPGTTLRGLPPLKTAQVGLWHAETSAYGVVVDLELERKFQGNYFTIMSRPALSVTNPDTIRAVVGDAILYRIYKYLIDEWTRERKPWWFSTSGLWRDVINNGRNIPQGTRRGRFSDYANIPRSAKGRLLVGCNHCGNQDKSQLSLCGGCNTAQYCSISCQSTDWEQHKHLCQE